MEPHLFVYAIIKIIHSWELLCNAIFVENFSKCIIKFTIRVLSLNLLNAQQLSSRTPAPTYNLFPTAVINPILISILQTKSFSLRKCLVLQWIFLTYSFILKAWYKREVMFLWKVQNKTTPGFDAGFSVLASWHATSTN